MKVNRINQVLNNDQTQIINNASRRGPFVLEERHFAETFAYYGKTCLPEDNRSDGSFSAFGVFKLTNSMKSYTNLSFLQQEGMETAVSVRFSTMPHDEHTAETMREPHGFDVTFLTEEGNYDFVGNNFPISFVHDYVASAKWQNRLDIQDPVRFWEFVSNTPESINMLIHMFTDEGIPASYRTMRGATVHAFRWVNAEGKECLAKLRWIPKQGIVNLNVEEAARVKHLDSHYATHDIYMAIERGDFPEWDLFVQILDPEKISMYNYDPLDPTKEWLECDFPYHKAGTMILNQNISEALVSADELKEHDVSMQWIAGRSYIHSGNESHDDFMQAGEIYRSYRADVQKTVINNLAHELNTVKEKREDIVADVIELFYKADKSLGKALASRCNICLDGRHH